MGEAPEAIVLVEHPDDVDRLEFPAGTKLAYLTQTTLSVDDANRIIRRLTERFPGIVSPPKDDICYATQNRQAAVKAIAEQCDVVVVVGSGNSSNSVRLVEVALQAGARSAHRVDAASELDESWFDDAPVVGVTSGASVPEILVDDVLSWLSARGWSSVSEVHTADETLIFALPPELRRDIKAASRTE